MISSGLVAAGFVLNAVLAGYGLFRGRQPFSLVQVFWIFCLLFMSLVPLLQFCTALQPWGRQFGHGTYVSANIMISAALISCLIMFRRSPLSGMNAGAGDAEISVTRYRSIGMVIFLIAAAALLWLSWPAILWRSNSEQAMLGQLPQPVQLLADKLLRGAVLYVALISIYLYRQGKTGIAQLVFVLVLALLCNFPLAVPRYWAATFIVALLTAACAGWLKHRPFFFRTALSLVILLVFPVLSLTRYSRDYILQHFHSPGDIFRLSFAYGDFDAYTSFCSTISYVQQHGITWGRQLLSVLLFFVPRSVWPGKGIGSGALVNRLPGSDFTNFCSPLFAEGYINFGVPGAVLFVVLFARGLRCYDHYYHTTGSRSFAWFFYPVALGMSIFILRGDLLSSFAYTCGFAAAGYGMHLLLRERKA